MIRREMFTELTDMEDTLGSMSPERIRRQKPGWDDTEEERPEYQRHLRRQRVRTELPSGFLQEPQYYWSGFRTLVRGWREPSQRRILDMFMASNGPMAVAAGIKKEIAFIRGARGKLADVPSSVKVDGYGTTFERLACAWLKTEVENSQLSILDVGSTNRVAHVLNRVSGVYILPDGLIISRSSPPLLEAICEYKTNPTGSVSQLQKQIIGMEEFFVRNRNMVLYAGRKRTFMFDKHTFWSSKEIQIASKPSIILVIPEDQEYTPESEYVEVRKAPFSVVHIGRILGALINDIDAQGLVASELRLLKQSS
jgi:hypothetical protein